MGNQTSATMSGYVCMSDDNHVRWRFVRLELNVNVAQLANKGSQRSGEQLNPIWSSEGVQIGGLSSTYGVLGSWTTTFHDPLDPVGASKPILFLQHLLNQVDRSFLVT